MYFLAACSWMTSNKHFSIYLSLHTISAQKGFTTYLDSHKVIYPYNLMQAKMCKQTPLTATDIVKFSVTLKQRTGSNGPIRADSSVDHNENISWQLCIPTHGQAACPQCSSTPFSVPFHYPYKAPEIWKNQRQTSSSLISRETDW